MLIKSLILVAVYTVYASNETAKYGDFDLTLMKTEKCKGPKRKQCADIIAHRVNQTWTRYDAFVTDNMTTIRNKISGLLNNKEVVRFQVKNMCEHVFFKPVIQAMYNVDGSRCGIYKGNYTFNVNIQSLARNFVGSKFMYGNWSFKTVLYNDQCTMHCEINRLMITPKDNIDT